MADVQPFRGLRYNLERIGDLSLVISPPYDVISPDEQLLYYRKSPYNIIRLELGEERANDIPENNRYTRAARTLESWLQEAVLIRERHPAFYVVEHRFPYQDTIRSRFGLIACVRLEGLNGGRIRPHEMTMMRPIGDRLRLLEACRANLSPIMALFRSEGEGIGMLLPEARVTKPHLSAVDGHGVIHNMWVVTDEKATAGISQFFANKTLYIADGHHRYEAALIYQRAQYSVCSSYTGNEAFNFVMMALAESGDPNMIMMPTHRLVRGIKAETLAGFKERLDIYFHVEELLPPSRTLSDTLRGWLDTLKDRGQSGIAFGLYGLHGKRLLILTVRQNGSGQPQLALDLDVDILHRLILREMLGVDDKREDCLEYTRDALNAVSRVNRGEFQLAFLLNPAPISSVLAVADAGIRLPQRSTYFYPKTPAGLVINPLWDD